VEGTLVKAPTKIESCTQSEVELHISQLFVVSMAEPRLPLLIEDAMRPEIEVYITSYIFSLFVLQNKKNHFRAMKERLPNKTLSSTIESST
jgi:hypothetical protein